jgi:hypothetical protein
MGHVILTQGDVSMMTLTHCTASYAMWIIFTIFNDIIENVVKQYFSQDQHVFNLRKRPKSHIPIMNFTYCTHFMHLKLNWEPEELLEYQCVRFEISFVTLQGYGTISAQTLENTQLLIKNFKMAEEDIYKINWSDKRAGMINTLAGKYALIVLGNKKNKFADYPKRMVKFFSLTIMVMDVFPGNGLNSGTCIKYPFRKIKIYQIFFAEPEKSSRRIISIFPEISILSKKCNKKFFKCGVF